MSNTYAIDPETGLPSVVCLDGVFQTFQDDLSYNGQQTYENALDVTNSAFDKNAQGSCVSNENTFSQFSNAELTEMIQNWEFGFDGGLSEHQTAIIQELRQRVTYLRLKEKEDHRMKIATAIGVVIIIIVVFLWIASAVIH